MSYDLDFWKYKQGVELNHQQVYECLSDGQYVDGLEDLPIDDFIARISQVFSEGWNKVDEMTWESIDGTFQLFTTQQFIRVDCYGLSSENMNKLIDILAEFGCPLYDPQVGQRYAG